MTLRRLSLRQQLSGLVVIVSVGLFLSLAYVFQAYLVRQALMRARQQQVGAAQSIARDIADQLAHATAALQLAAKRLPPPPTEEEVASVFRLSAAGGRAPRFALVAEMADGSVSGPTRPAEIPARRWREWVKALLRSERNSRLMKLSGGKSYLFLRSPVVRSTRTGGRTVLIGAIEDKAIFSLGRKVDSGQRLAIAGGGTVLIAESSLVAEGKPGYTRPRSMKVERLVSRLSSAGYIAASGKVPGHPISVWVARPRSYFLGGISEGVAQTLAVTLGLMTVGTLAVLAVVGRAAGELRQVSDYAQTIGDLDSEAEYRGSVSSKEVDNLTNLLSRVRKQVLASSRKLLEERRRAEELAKENELLFRVERQVAEGAGKMSQFAHALSTTMDPEERMRMTLEAIAAVVSARAGVIVSRRDGAVVFSAGDLRPGQNEAEWARGLLETPAVSDAIARQRPTVVTGDAAKALPIPGIRNGVIAPLLGTRGHRCAALVVDISRDLSDLDLGLIRSMAEYASIEIENAELFQQKVAAGRKASTLLRSSMWISESISSGEVASRLVDTLLELTGAGAALFSWKLPSGKSKVIATSNRQNRQQPPERLLRWASSVLDRSVHRGAHYIDLARAAAELEGGSALDGVLTAGMDHAMVVPLTLRGKSAGSVYIFGDAPAISSADISTVATLSNMALTALENARSYERKHRISEVLQRGLLPSRLPTIEGADIAAFYASATEEAYVGGDFYDVTAISPDRFALLLGDVCGKGISAARTSSLVKEVCSYLLLVEDDPAKVMGELNKTVLARNHRGHFVSALLAVVDLSDGTVSVANAGHPPAIIVTGQGQGRTLRYGDVVLGAVHEFQYGIAKEKMEPGDRLIIYSDGVTEARRRGEFYGEDRLLSAGVARPSGSSREFVSYLSNEVREFCGGRLSDDMAILVCGLTGSITKRKVA